MFGHAENQQVDNTQAQGMPDPAMAHDQTMPTSGAADVNPFGPTATTTSGAVSGLSEIPAAPAANLVNNNPFALPTTPAPEPTVQSDFAAPSAPPADEDDSDATNDDLIDLKQKALQELSPLVGHLEQDPEEKFKTTMMMIQASDDQSLLPAAYEAAQAITDEKAKAQALLDVVNEINYFTQSH